MATMIRGIVGTPVTPFTADNRVDGPTVQRLVDFLIRHGAHAIGLPMHIGENISMSTAERRELVRLAVEAAGGRVPVFANTSLSGTDEVVALSRDAQAAGAKGLVVIAPYHWQPARAPLLDHFATVAGAVDIALIAYNFPERMGVTLTPDLLVELIERCPNFVGIKDASFRGAPRLRRVHRRGVLPPRHGGGGRGGFLRLWRGGAAPGESGLRGVRGRGLRAGPPPSAQALAPLHAD
jgi:dihydrodipicolinate synthase/N-acetylneuraminate lyase